MKNSGVLTVAAALVLGSVLCSHGYGSIITFDNLSPTQPYYINYGSWFGTRPIDPSLTQIAANGFTPSTSGYLEELWLGIFTYSNNNELILTLYSDNYDSLGTQLWRQTFTGVMGEYGSLAHVSGLATGHSPKLLAGQSYWLTAEAPDDGQTYHAWYTSNTGDLGNWGSADNGVWDFKTSHWRYAMRIGVSPVPEPATAHLILGASAYGLVAARRRRK